MKNILILAGARPNFIKIAPLITAFVQRGMHVFLVHTGQHYDIQMSEVFFQELGIPKPEVNLGVGPGDRRSQTKKIVDALVPILRERTPDALVVVGDVTSTAAGTLAGIVAGTPVVHVEAGLRSFNWRMPEELNRMIADQYADYLFVSDPSGLEHLSQEAISSDRVFDVGNVMIDTLRRMEPQADVSDALARFKLNPKTYGLLTLHRPENVDDPEVLRSLWELMQEAADRLPLVFPVHPRTRTKLEPLTLNGSGKIRLIDPVGYIDMLALIKNAQMVLTDSGGLQEEATVLGIPCLTLREQTERPITVTLGTSEILGRDREAVLRAVDRVLQGEWKKGVIPPLWDGHTAERIADVLSRL